MAPENSDKIIELVEKFAKDYDIKSFISGVKNVWTDYDEYVYDKSYVDLQYTLKGVKFQINVTSNHGMILANNYTGNIGKDVTLEDVLQDPNRIPRFTYFEMDKDLVYEKEKERREKERIRYSEKNPKRREECNLFFLEYEQEEYINNVKIISKDKQYPNYEMTRDSNIYSIIWADDFHVIYSLKNKGIYEFDLTTQRVREIITGSDDFKLNKIENNMIQYDDNKVIQR